MAFALEYADVVAVASLSDADADSVQAQVPTPWLAFNGMTSSVVIGGRVWLDEDGDGEKDPGEPGLRNVELTLQPAMPIGKVCHSAADNPVRRQRRLCLPRPVRSCRASSPCIIAKVVPGYYQVEINADSVPAGLVSSSGALISDVIKATGGGTFLDVAFAFENPNPAALFHRGGPGLERLRRGRHSRSLANRESASVTLDLVGDGSDLTMTTEDDDYDSYDPVDNGQRRHLLFPLRPGRYVHGGRDRHRQGYWTVLR